MEMDSPTDESEVFTKPEPEFPQSEYMSRSEGWVLIDYSVSRGGIVEHPYVRESSGNSGFEEAALNGVREWRYVPGDQRELSVLISFVGGRDEPVSERFFTLNNQAHELIDGGELERATELLAKARDEDDLTLSELAYSYLTEGRIAGKRGDRAEQLHFYRKAMLNNGRWLRYDNYLEALHVAVVLELDQGDNATAVRDYDLLTETRDGKKLGADLEDLVKTARAQIEADPSIMQPYVVADNSMIVQPDRPPVYYSGYRREPGSTPDSRSTNSRPRSPRSRSGSGSGSGSKKD
jgi:TonB family protein